MQTYHFTFAFLTQVQTGLIRARNREEAHQFAYQLFVQFRMDHGYSTSYLIRSQLNNRVEFTRLRDTMFSFRLKRVKDRDLFLYPITVPVFKAFKDRVCHTLMNEKKGSVMPIILLILIIIMGVFGGDLILRFIEGSFQ